MTHACNLSIWEVGKGGPGVHHSQICSKFDTNLVVVFMEPCLKEGKGGWSMVHRIVLACQDQNYGFNPQHHQK